MTCVPVWCSLPDMITATLNNMASEEMNGSNGPWTKYTVVLDGKKYQCKQAVFNQAKPLLGHLVDAEVESQEKNGYTNWYVKAVFSQGTGTPEPQPNNPAARAMNAQAASQGMVTDLARHESISRMAAVKHLVEAGTKPEEVGTLAFMLRAETLSVFYLTGKTGVPTEPEKRDEPEIEFAPEKPFVPQAAIDAPFDSTPTDDDIPF